VAQLRTSGQLPKESALFLRMNAKHSRSETTDDRANNNNSISNGVNFLLVADGGTVGQKNETNELDKRKKINIYKQSWIHVAT